MARTISGLAPEFVEQLPETARLIEAGNLVLHASVRLVTLHGSRGPRGTARPDSDLDLSLICDCPGDAWTVASAAFLREVLGVTLRNWMGSTELDLAAILDVNRCGLRCFEVESYKPDVCRGSGVGCFGVFKIQKGFDGFVPPSGIRVEGMYPCCVTWKRGGRA